MLLLHAVYAASQLSSGLQHSFVILQCLIQTVRELFQGIQRVILLHERGSFVNLFHVKFPAGLFQRIRRQAFGEMINLFLGCFASRYSATQAIFSSCVSAL